MENNTALGQYEVDDEQNIIKGKEFEQGLEVYITNRMGIQPKDVGVCNSTQCGYSVNIDKK